MRKLRRQEASKECEKHEGDQCGWSLVGWAPEEREVGKAQAHGMPWPTSRSLDFILRLTGGLLHFSKITVAAAQRHGGQPCHPEVRCGQWGCRQDIAAKYIPDSDLLVMKKITSNDLDS